MHAWSDWTEWHQVYQLIYGSGDPQLLLESHDHDLASEAPKASLARALTLISRWLRKNVGANEHTKALKMQKLLLVEAISIKKMRERSQAQQDDFLQAERQNSSKFRLIQLVELAAKTAAYKKSKQGGKLAMRDIAEQQGLPSFLVHLRHQAVHEAQSMTAELLQKGIKRMQHYLFESYWYPLLLRIMRRDEQIETFRQQVLQYRIGQPGTLILATPPSIDKLMQEGADSGAGGGVPLHLQIRQTLNKYNRSNLKLSVPLDLNQSCDLCKLLVDSSLQQLQVKFKDMKLLRKMVNQFHSANGGS